MPSAHCIIKTERGATTMSVSFVQHPPNGDYTVSTTQQKALANALTGLTGPVVIAAAEGEGRTLANIVQFIQSGGIWISWSGYPFYYTPSTDPSGVGYNFGRFCQLLGVPDPSPSRPGNEFFAPVGYRTLWTPLSQTTLPSPWITGMSRKVFSSGASWPLIAVPAGAGWWFYADQTVSTAQYAAFIQSLAAAVSSTTASAASSPRSLPWDWIIVGGALAIGVGAVVVIERH